MNEVHDMASSMYMHDLLFPLLLSLMWFWVTERGTLTSMVTQVCELVMKGTNHHSFSAPYAKGLVA
jgi:hypothetical protein